MGLWQSLSADKTSRQREKNAGVPLIMQLQFWHQWSTEQRVQPRREKICLWVFTNNTGADQPAHPRSLISAFVVGFLESIICKLAPGKISLF